MRRASTTPPAGAPIATAPRWVTLAGRRVAVRRPRVRATDASDGEPGEVGLGPLSELHRHRPVGPSTWSPPCSPGVSSRKYHAALEPVGDETSGQAAATSKSAVSCQFVQATSERLVQPHQRRLDAQHWPVVFVNGFTFGEHQLVGALEASADGTQVPLGVVEGTT